MLDFQLISQFTNFAVQNVSLRCRLDIHLKYNDTIFPRLFVVLHVCIIYYAMTASCASVVGTVVHNTTCKDLALIQAPLEISVYSLQGASNTAKWQNGY